MTSIIDSSPHVTTINLTNSFGLFDPITIEIPSSSQRTIERQSDEPDDDGWILQICNPWLGVSFQVMNLMMKGGSLLLTQIQLQKELEW